MAKLVSYCSASGDHLAKRELSCLKCSNARLKHEGNCSERVMLCGAGLWDTKLMDFSDFFWQIISYYLPRKRFKDYIRTKIQHK